MSDKDDEISLEQAAKTVQPVCCGQTFADWKTHGQHLLMVHSIEADRPANVPGAEATAVLETMLAASRRGKTVR